MTTFCSVRQISRHVGDSIRLVREMQCQLKERLAADVGMSVERLLRIESGEEEATSTDLHLFAKKLGVQVSEFFEGLVGFRCIDMGPRVGTEQDLSQSDSASIGMRLYLARMVRKMSIQDLAEGAEIDPTRIWRIELGEEEATASDLHAITGTLAIDIPYLLESTTDTVGWPAGGAEMVQSPLMV